MERMAKRGDFLTGSFRDHGTAERAYNRLQDRGYTDQEITIMMSDATRKKYFGKESQIEEDEKLRSYGNETAEGTGIGPANRQVAGTTTGMSAAIGTSLIIPGLGLIIAGPLAAGIASAGANGATGGIVNALVTWGIPENRAKNYGKDIKEGHIILNIKPHSETDAEYIEEEWHQYEAQDVYR